MASWVRAIMGNQVGHIQGNVRSRLGSSWVASSWSGAMMRPMRALVLLSVVAVAACGGGSSVADYAEDVEVLVVTMNAGLDDLDAELDGTQNLQQIQDYARDRVIYRSDFVTGLSDLDPPDELAEFHNTAIGIMERLTDAESALADRVMALESDADIEAIWDTPEGVAARTADTQAVALCLAAQAEFDQTADRAELTGVLWIPPEMKEVVLVAFGCIAEDR